MAHKLKTISLETGRVLNDIAWERIAQDYKWGEQNHPDGTSKEDWEGQANYYRYRCDVQHRTGEGTFADILLEEVFEALSEIGETKLRTELVQVAAVAVSWIEAIDRRSVSV